MLELSIKQKGTGPHSEHCFFWIVVVTVGQCVGAVMVVGVGVGLCGFAREKGRRLEGMFDQRNASTEPLGSKSIPTDGLGIRDWGM